MFRVNQSKEKEKYTKYFSNIKMHNSILYLKRTVYKKKRKYSVYFSLALLKGTPTKHKLNMEKIYIANVKRARFQKRQNDAMLLLFAWGEELL